MIDCARINIICDDEIRTLRIKGADSFLFQLEQAVTSGLGYEPVREVFKEGGIDTNEGLMRHLGNMDLLTAKRQTANGYLNAKVLAQATIYLEDRFIDFRDDYDSVIDIIDCVLQRFGKELIPKLPRRRAG